MNKECETCIKRKTVYCPTSIECMATDDKPYYQNRIMLLEENQELKKQNDSLKQRLNWIAFGDDSELALRYLRKIGYVDFDEERKVYINKHNNEPFLLEDEQEKGYYIKDEELNEYTEQLEYQVKSLKEQLEKKQNPLQGVFAQVNDDMLLRNCGAMQSEIDKYESQQKKFIEYLEAEISGCEAVSNLLFSHNKEMKVYKEVLQKYKEIIGGKE